MGRMRMQRFRFVGVVLAFTLLIAACSDDGGDDSGEP